MAILHLCNIYVCFAVFTYIHAYIIFPFKQLYLTVYVDDVLCYTTGYPGIYCAAFIIQSKRQWCYA